jgi:hypothetical protein
MLRALGESGRAEAAMAEAARLARDLGMRTLADSAGDKPRAAG